MNVLVIVDMQVTYNAAQDPALIARVEERIEAALNSGWRVVAVHFDGSGESTVRLPPGTPILWKSEDGGGEQVYSWLLGAELIGRELQVVFGGVNTTACVFKTAMGLADRISCEAALVDAVQIDLSICGDKSRPRVRFVGA